MIYHPQIMDDIYNDFLKYFHTLTLYYYSNKLLEVSE
jgi:hypothetical protein